MQRRVTAVYIDVNEPQKVSCDFMQQFVIAYITANKSVIIGRS